MDVADPNRGEGVQIGKELKLVGIAAAFLLQLYRDLVQTAQQVNALGEISLGRVPEVVDCALPFEDGAEEVDLGQGCVFVKWDGLEAGECDGREDGCWGRRDAGLFVGDCGCQLTESANTRRDVFSPI